LVAGYQISQRGTKVSNKNCTFVKKDKMVDYRNIITLEPGKRSGKPCIRGMRITVGDILGWLAAGMTTSEILNDFDELTETDILAALSYAADRENKNYQIAI
jgi:uncharacterized protein (DUF433 family)